MWLFLILLAVPLVEIALFIQVGGLIGLWPTLGLVILTAVIGTALMRAQGLKALDRLRSTLAGGENPTGPIVDAAMILVAGMLLLTPGFFTDSLGLLLLVPPVRATLFRHAAGALRGRYTVQTFRTDGPRRRAEVIDADYEVLDDVPPSQRGASGWTRPRA